MFFPFTPHFNGKSRSSFYSNFLKKKKGKHKEKVNQNSFGHRRRESRGERSRVSRQVTSLCSNFVRNHHI